MILSVVIHLRKKIKSVMSLELDINKFSSIKTQKSIYFFIVLSIK